MRLKFPLDVRMSLLLLLVCAADGRFVGENPGSSLVFSYHVFLEAVRLLRAVGIKARLGREGLDFLCSVFSFFCFVIVS